MLGSDGFAPEYDRPLVTWYVNRSESKTSAWPPHFIHGVIIWRYIIPKNEKSPYIDAAVLTWCSHKVELQDIAQTHLVGKAAAGRHRQVLSKVSIRKIRERVFLWKCHLNWAREMHISDQCLRKWRLHIAKKKTKIQSNIWERYY